MKNALKKLLSLVLCLVLCLSLFPLSVFAEEEEETPAEEPADVILSTVEEEKNVQEHVHEYVLAEAEDTMREHYICAGCEGLFVLTEQGEYVEVTPEDLAVPAAEQPSESVEKTEEGETPAEFTEPATEESVPEDENAEPAEPDAAVPEGENGEQPAEEESELALLSEDSLCADNDTEAVNSGVLSMSGLGAIESELALFSGGNRCGDNLTWAVNDGVLTISGSGAMWDYDSNNPAPWILSGRTDNTITSAVIESGVTGIGDYAFYGLEALESVSISSSVAGIGRFAFAFCEALFSVSIPASVSTIADFAFYSCDSLASVSLSSGLKTLGNEAFHFCDSLTSVSLPYGLKTLGDSVFGYCRELRTIEIPYSIESVGSRLVEFCDLLEQVYYTGSSAMWNTVNVDPDNYVLKANIAYNDAMTDFGDFGDGFRWIYYSDGSLMIHGSGDMPSFTAVRRSIPWRTYRTDITTVSFDSGITAIGDYSFGYCSNLTGVFLPAGLVSIGQFAFYDCASLAGISFPPSVTTINQSAFARCSGLFSLTIPAGVKVIEQKAFCDCSGLTALSLPASVTTIKQDAFNGCSGLVDLTIPAAVKSVAEDAFHWCSGLQSICVEAGNTAYRAEGNCLIRISDSKVLFGCDPADIPEGVKSIGGYAFTGRTGTQNIAIPDSVVSIGEGAFKGCSGSAIRLDIGKGLKTIGEYAFRDCSGISLINVAPGNPTFRSEGNCLISRSSGELILGCRNSVIPTGVKKIGVCAFEACEQLYEISIPYGVTSIGGGAFGDCVDLEYVSIPASVTSIGESAFSSCSCLKSAALPAGLTSLGDGAFRECESLMSVTVPGTVKTVGEYTFFNCISLESAELQYGVNSIGEHAFYNCGDLVTLKLPESLSSIGPGAFKDCVSLASVMVPGSVSHLESEAFRGCLALQSVVLSNGMQSVGDEAFRDCGSLKEIVIPNGITEIGRSAFSGCYALETVYLPSSLCRVKSWAFENSLTKAFYAGSKSRWDAVEIWDNDYLISAVEATGFDNYIITAGSNEIFSWTLYNDGRLVFSGSGVIGDEDVEDIKWLPYSAVIQSVIIDSGITEIGRNAFYGCSALSSVTIPNTVTSIGQNAFYCCSNLTAVTIPSSVNAIDDGAFSGCSGLSRINIPEGITSINFDTFKNCISLVNITIPKSVSVIGSYSFAGCAGLTEIVIPDDVTSIRKGSFEGCSSLESVTIPAGVTSIGEDAFAGCYRLRLVTYAGTETQWYAVQGWNEVDYEGVRYCFSPIASDKCGDKLSWALSDCGVLTVSGTGAMWNFDWMDNPPPWMQPSIREQITSVVLKKGLTSIGDNAFSGLKLTSVSIPAGVTRIGEAAFSNCTVLGSVNLPSGLKDIDCDAFSGCGELSSIVIPSGVQRIGEFAFYCCGIQTLHLSAVNANIEASAFQSCSSLTNVILAPGITEIGEAWFDNCINLQSASIPASVTRIGESAFNNCTELTDVYYSGSQERWNALEANIEANNDPLFDCSVHTQASKTFTVLFDPNGGEGGSVTQSFVYGEAQTLALNTFTRVGYDFTGWKNGSAAYKDGQSVKNLTSTDGGVVTLKAQWKARATYPGYYYTIRFNGNGSTGGKTSTQSMRVGTAKALSANGFTKTGYHFSGWAAYENGPVVYANKQSVKDVNIELMTTEQIAPVDVELFARWDRNTYTVTFNGNGGKLANGKTTPYQQMLCYDTMQTFEDCRFIREGYTFLGWSTVKKAAAPNYFDAQTGRFNLTEKNGGKVTLYAVWRANTYHVEFRRNSFSASGSTVTQYIAYGKSVKLNAVGFVNPGFSFAGWNTKEDGSGKTFANKASVKNLCSGTNAYATLYAMWKPNTYTVVFKSNGGTGKAPAAQKGYSNTQKIDIPQNTFTFGAYEFAGWNTKNDGTGTMYQPGQKIVFDTKNKATVTLYATWKYSARFDTGSCNGVDLVTVFTNDSLIYNRTYKNSLSSELLGAFYPDGAIPDGTQGYYLAGWNKDEAKASRGEVKYAANAVKNIGPGAELYAVWKPCTYTIKFNSNGGKGTMKTLSMKFNTAKALTANAFKKTGAEFLGWSTKQDGPVVFTNKMMIKNELVPWNNKEVILLYAVWSS